MAQTHTHTDMETLRLNRPSGADIVRKKLAGHLFCRNPPPLKVDVCLNFCIFLDQHLLNFSCWKHIYIGQKIKQNRFCSRTWQGQFNRVFSSMLLLWLFVFVAAPSLLCLLFTNFFEPNFMPPEPNKTLFSCGLVVLGIYWQIITSHFSSHLRETGGHFFTVHLYGESWTWLNCTQYSWTQFSLAKSRCRLN